MNINIKGIDFKESIHTYFNNNNIPRINKLSKINLFIGANNSGKSRFLRGLFNKEYNYVSVDFSSHNDLFKRINNFDNLIKEELSKQRIQRILNFEYQFPTLKEDNFYELVPYYQQTFKDLKQFRCNGLEDFRNMIHRNGGIVNHLTYFINNQSESILKEINGINFKRKFQRCYIPVLRGLRPIGEIEDYLYPYKKRTLKDYFPDFYKENGYDESYRKFHNSIITGLNFYDDCKKMLLGTAEQRQKVKKFESFLSKNFFNNKEINIIPRVNEDGNDTKIIHLLIDKEERPIYEFGDGIQSIIVLTYHMFFNKDKNICYFIEEPDLYLHPGYQRVFLNLLSSEEFINHQFFITTHSNHFLDYTIDTDDISIYTFNKESTQKYVIENVSSGDSKTLELLGVRNSSVFLSNCTIWVEGITDRLYIRKYLELYFEENLDEVYLEDIHYSFLEYGGGNITHWSFLESDEDSNINVDRLCGRLFLITDKDGTNSESEKENSAKSIRHQKLNEKLKERYYCLKSREIENLISDKILKKVIKSYQNVNEDVDLKNIIYQKYKDQPLGKFIDDNVEGLGRSFSAKSGTVSDKVNFCKKTIKELSSYNELSEEAKELTTKIVEFIKDRN